MPRRLILYNLFLVLLDFNIPFVIQGLTLKLRSFLEANLRGAYRPKVTLKISMNLLN